MINGLLIAVTVAYPFLVYFTLERLEPWVLAAGLCAVVIIRHLLMRNASAMGLWMTIALVVFAVVVAGMNSADALKFYPVIVNAGMLAIFGYSLYRPPTVIERIARLGGAELPPRGVAYTRTVTWIWCGFFVVNGAIAAWSALFASLAWWSLYNGFIAYVAMGVLFLGEWLVRRRVQPS